MRFITLTSVPDGNLVSVNPQYIVSLSLHDYPINWQVTKECTRVVTTGDIFSVEEDADTILELIHDLD